MDFQIVGPESLLARHIANDLHKELIVPDIIRFADGELEVKFSNPERLKDNKVFIIQSTNPPVHDHIMQLLLTIFQAQNVGAQEIIAVIPYFGYARHDKAYIPGTESEVKLIADLFQSAGVQKVITVALHSEKIIEYFQIPVTNLWLADVIAKDIKTRFKDLTQICLVAPDVGAQPRIAKVCEILGIGHIFFTKKRIAADKTLITAVDVHCHGKIAIMIDDIIDTGGTAVNACDELLHQGFSQVYGYFIHAVLSGNAISRIEHSNFSEVFVSNSIPLTQDVTKIKIFDITNVLVQAIKMM
jgi:ribose-phosphate pyrophosphokinase